MSIASKFVAAAFVAACSLSSIAATTQATSPVSYSTTDWHNDLLANVTFAANTNAVSALTGSVSIADQGWGGEDPVNNQLYLVLNVDGASVWADHFAGAMHGWSYQTFDISNNSASFDSLNTALGAVAWTDSTNVELQLRSSTIGYPGWALNAYDAQFSVTSSVAAVPEPETYALLAAGLGFVAFVTKRRNGRA